MVDVARVHLALRGWGAEEEADLEANVEAHAGEGTGHPAAGTAGGGAADEL